MLTRTLPPPPQASFSQTVPLPAIAPGMQPVAIAGACLVRLDTANGRISAWRKWYDDIRKAFDLGQ